MDDSELEKRAKLCARICHFLIETKSEYTREGLRFEGFLADVQYAMAYMLKEIAKNIDDFEEDEDDGKGTE